MVKHVNYDKVREITEEEGKNQAVFPGQMTGIQEGHQYRPRVHRREDTSGHAFYHPGYSWHPEKITEAWGWAPNPTVNLGRRGLQGL